MPAKTWLGIDPANPLNPANWDPPGAPWPLLARPAGNPDNELAGLLQNKENLYIEFMVGHDTPLIPLLRELLDDIEQQRIAAAEAWRLPLVRAALDRIELLTNGESAADTKDARL